MNADLAAILYLVSGVLFILALRGLSHPETARRGNYFGMAGMAVAIITSLLAAGVGFGGFLTIMALMAVGGGVGAVVAKRIPMTAMPQLVAAFHSLVGMSAVLVALAAFYRPDVFDIGVAGDIKHISLVELSLGSAIGAITFSGSVIAFMKLQGLVSGAPVIFKGQHWLNLALGGIIALMVVFLVASGGELTFAFWALTIVAFILGVTDQTT